MNKRASGVIIGAIVLLSSPCHAESQAVSVTIGSGTGAVDAAAVQTVLQVIGHAVGSGTVRRLVVSSPALSSSRPVGSGLTACVEAAGPDSGSDIAVLLQGLHSIRPRRGTYYKVSRADDCSDGGSGGVACTQDAKQCPDGSFVGRVPPTCEFAPCP
jgi:hypothetical protein